MTSGGRVRRLGPPLALAAALVAGGCVVAERERLDVPRVALDVDDVATPAGGRITGRAAASDASGLTSLAVYACSRDSLFRMSEAYDGQDQAEIDFSLHVATNALPGDPVEVYAVAYDDQGFSTDSALVVFVGGGAGSPGAGAGLCTQPRAVRARVAPLSVTGP